MNGRCGGPARLRDGAPLQTPFLARHRRTILNLSVHTSTHTSTSVAFTATAPPQAPFPARHNWALLTYLCTPLFTPPPLG